MAALNSAGVLLTSPAASTRYSGTGSVTATATPSWSALMASTFVTRPAILSANASAFRRKNGASSGRSAPNSSATRCATAATVGRSYHTCSLTSPGLSLFCVGVLDPSWDARPADVDAEAAAACTPAWKTATALITGADESDAAIMVSIQSS